MKKKPDENEGIYIKDTKSGKVRAIIGETYMLNQDEELWEKLLPADIEKLLLKIISKKKIQEVRRHLAQ